MYSNFKQKSQSVSGSFLKLQIFSVACALMASVAKRLSKWVTALSHEAMVTSSLSVLFDNSDKRALIAMRAGPWINYQKIQTGALVNGRGVAGSLEFSLEINNWDRFVFVVRLALHLDVENLSYILKFERYVTSKSLQFVDEKVRVVVNGLLVPVDDW